MGAWATSIAQGAGRAGSEYGTAVDSNIRTALDVIQGKLLQQEVRARMAEQQQRMQINAAPHSTYLPTPQGGTAVVQESPLTGQTSQPQTVIPGTPSPPKTLQQSMAEAIEKNDFPRAQKIMDMISAQYKTEHPTKESSIEERLSTARTLAQEQGLTPGTPEYNKRVLEIYNPPAAKVTYNLGGKGAGGGDDALDMKAQMVMNGTPIEKVTTPKTLGKLLTYMKSQGMTPPTPLTPSAQKTLEESSPVHEQIQQLLTQFEPLKNDNTPMKYFRQRAEYALGIQSPIAGTADAIAQLELNRVVGAARVMKGSSRAVGMLQKAMIHLPDVWIDSPKLIYSKLDNLDKALTQIETDAVRYGKKGGVATQSTDDLINALPLPSH